MSLLSTAARKLAIPGSLSLVRVAPLPTQHACSGIPTLSWRNSNPLSHGSLVMALGKRWQHSTVQEAENISVEHSHFVAEAPARAKWKEAEEGGMGIDATGEDFESVSEGKGAYTLTTRLWHRHVHGLQASSLPHLRTSSSSSYHWDTSARTTQPAQSRSLHRLPSSSCTPPNRSPTSPASSSRNSPPQRPPSPSRA